MRHRALEGERERVELEGLGDEVVRAEANGLHRRLDASEGGDDDHRQARVTGHQLAAHVEAGPAAQVQIGDHHVVAGARRLRQRLGAERDGRLRLQHAVQGLELGLGRRRAVKGHDR